MDQLEREWEQFTQEHQKAAQGKGTCWPVGNKFEQRRKALYQGLVKAGLRMPIKRKYRSAF